PDLVVLGFARVTRKTPTERELGREATPTKGTAMRILNPKNDALLCEVTEDTPASARDKFARSQQAQAAWFQVPLEERLSTIRRFRDAVTAERDMLATTLTREVGKPITQSRSELAALTQRLDFFLTATPDVLAQEEVLTDADGKQPLLREVIRPEPLGTVLNISAWNYPWFVGSNVI